MGVAYIGLPDFLASLSVKFRVTLPSSCNAHNFGESVTTYMAPPLLTAVLFLKSIIDYVLI